MSRRHDLGALLLSAALLLICVVHLAQCDSTSQRGDTTRLPRTSAGTPGESAGREIGAKGDAEHHPKSIQEFAAEEGKEEREKLRSISRALQTLAADPQQRRTYGFPP